MDREDELKEMLKLYSKKDLWDRIMQKYHQIAVLEKALELACNELNAMKYYYNDHDIKGDYTLDLFKQQAEKELEDERIQ